MDILLSLPIAFLIYIPLVVVLLKIGKAVASRQEASELKSSTYSSGEEAPLYTAAPGYRPFFLIAFFFAILHLGMLVLGSGTLTLDVVPYLLGMVLAMLALLLG